MNSATDWGKIKVRLENGESANAIAKEWPISRQAIEKRAKKEGWGKYAKNEGKAQPINWLQVANATEIAGTRIQGSEIGKRSPENIAAILSKIYEGAPEKVAAQAQGIHPTTLSDWKKKDPVLANVIEMAKSSKVIARIDRIEESSKTDWKAASYLLEHDPDSKAEFNKAANSVPPNLNLLINIER